MYHTCSIDIHKKHPLYPCLDRACSCANSMYNVTNFYIRNLMTGLRKAPGTATPNEVFVMDTVRDAVDGVNKKFHDRYEAGVRAVIEDEGLSEQERLERLGALKYKPFEMPDAEKWFAGYGLLDAVFRYTDNPDYRACHAHVMQNAVKDCCRAWRSYFEALRKYKAGAAGFTGRPAIPRYRKPGGRAAAWIIRQIRLCGEMYEAAAARNRCLSGAVSERFERAAGIPGYGHTLPDSLEDVRWSAECACGCTASSVRSIKSRSYTTFANMFHTHAGSRGKGPWDDILSHTGQPPTA